MRVFYSRISTDDGQTHKRQLQDLKGFDYVFCDVISGSSNLFERGKGKEIKKLMDEGKLTHLEVHSIDRLGRNTIDVLSNWKLFTDNKVTVVCRNPNIRNYDDKGNPDKFSELLLSVLSVMYSFEKETILTRVRRVGTSYTPEVFLERKKSQDILNYLNKGTYTYMEISRILGVSQTTISKVKKMSELVNSI
ncbi:MAG: recombinase family protein [Bacteroidetes bacterium]|nr:recombinase family protein [Bacteroidota bacterium]